LTTTDCVKQSTRDRSRVTIFEPSRQSLNADSQKSTIYQLLPLSNSGDAQSAEADLDRRRLTRL